MPTQTSRSSILTQARPPCTAVKGCKRKAAQVSYELPGGRRCRICAMHLQRIRRTGELGPAETVWSSKPERKDRNLAILEAMRSVRSVAGRAWRVVSDGRGECLVVGVGRRRKAVPFSTATLRALERRGWVAISAWHPDGSRTAIILPAGLRALDGP